jgi:hypothetical protein
LKSADDTACAALIKLIGVSRQERLVDPEIDSTLRIVMPALVAEGGGAVWPMARRQDGQCVEEVSQGRVGGLAVVDRLRPRGSRRWWLGNSGGRVRGSSHGTRHRPTSRVPLPDRVSFARSLRSPHDLSPSALDALARPPGDGCPAGAARRGASWSACHARVSPTGLGHHCTTEVMRRRHTHVTWCKHDHALIYIRAD